MTGKQYAALQGADSIVSDAYDAGVEYGAIAFAKWLCENGYALGKDTVWILPSAGVDGIPTSTTPKELLITFLKQKG